MPFSQVSQAVTEKVSQLGHAADPKQVVDAVLPSIEELGRILGQELSQVRGGQALLNVAAQVSRSSVGLMPSPIRGWMAPVVGAVFGEAPRGVRGRSARATVRRATPAPRESPDQAPCPPVTNGRTSPFLGASAEDSILWRPRVPHDDDTATELSSEWESSSEHSDDEEAVGAGSSPRAPSPERRAAPSPEWRATPSPSLSRASSVAPSEVEGTFDAFAALLRSRGFDAAFVARELAPEAPPSEAGSARSSASEAPSRTSSLGLERGSWTPTWSEWPDASEDAPRLGLELSPGAFRTLAAEPGTLAAGEWPTSHPLEIGSDLESTPPTSPRGSFSDLASLLEPANEGRPSLRLVLLKPRRPAPAPHPKKELPVVPQLSATPGSLLVELTPGLEDGTLKMTPVAGDLEVVSLLKYFGANLPALPKQD